MVKIPKKYRGLMFAVLMASSTALLVSGAITYIHQVPMESFLNIWLYSFLTAWPIVFMAILVLAPTINKVLDKLIEQ